MQLVGQPCGLAALSFQALDDFAQGMMARGGRVAGGRFFEQSETSGTQALDGIRLAFGKQGLAVVLVACRLADRDGFGERQTAQEGFQVAGILAGRIETHVEMHCGRAFVELLQLQEESIVSLAGFDKLERRASRLEVVAQKGHMVAITGRIKADADGRCCGKGHGVPSKKRIAPGLGNLSSHESPPRCLR